MRPHFAIQPLLLASACLLLAWAGPAWALHATFFVTSDTHVCSSRDGVSPEVAKGHVWAMNHAALDGPHGGLKWPAGVPSAGEPIQEPLGILLAGDIGNDRLYDGQTAWGNCWNLFLDLYSGWSDHKKSWSSRYSVYPGFGNHDWADHACSEEGGDCGWYTPAANTSNRMIANFIERTVAGRTTRAFFSGGPDYASTPPLYSWDWDRLHLVSLNTWAGEPSRGVPTIPLPPDPGIYRPTYGWDWLKKDLQAHVERYGANAPIVIFQHYGYDVQSTSAAPRGYQKVWWSSADRAKFEDIIKDYNVIALFTGHSHEASVQAFGPQKQYLNVSAGNGSATGGFWTVHVTDTKLEMAYIVKDGLGKEDNVKMRIHPDPKLTVSRDIVTTSPRRSCPASTLYRLGNDHVTATFSAPQAVDGRVIRWQDGAAAKYRFPRCYRVWWTGQAATCSDGTWTMSPQGQMGRNAACDGSNINQPNLAVTYQ